MGDNMKKDKKLVFGVLALLVGIVAVSISYAAFTQSLNINGVANVQATSWSVHFANLTNAVTSGTAHEATSPTIKSGQTSIGDYSVDFYTPGDSITYTFDVVNEGDYDAKISVLTKGTPTCNGTDATSNTNVCANLEYTLKYTTNGETVSQNDPLRKGQTKNMTLVLKYKTTIGQNELPTAEVTVSNLGITIQYSQASLYDGANTELPAITYINRQNAGQITAEDEVAIGEEHFYVVSSDNTNTVLLAKYDLKSDGNGSYMQDTSGTSTNIVKVNFLDSNNMAYWDNANCTFNNVFSCPGTAGLKSEYANTSNPAGTTSYTTPYPEVYDSNAVRIYPVVESYVSKLSNEAGISITGKLMTYEQANNLSTNVRKDRNGYYYYLGSASSPYYVRNVYSSGDVLDYYGANSTIGVRPVIIVSTSDV